MSEVVIPRAIYISPGDPFLPPRGGQTAFAIQALNAFESHWALVSPDEKSMSPVGKWFLDEWKGKKLWRFNIGAYAPRNKSKRPFIPRRIVFRQRIKRYLPEIYGMGCKNIFCDSPEILGILNKYKWDSFCYRCAGSNNPVAVSRYPFLRITSQWFNRSMLCNLVRLRPSSVLASADERSIDQFQKQNSHFLSGLKISFFLSFFDHQIFYPGNKEDALESLGLKGKYPILITTGRLCWVKGWRLTLEALKELQQDYPSLLLLIVGDGEDRQALLDYASNLGVVPNIRLEGFLSPSEVRRRLVASDLYVCSSFVEGWSVALTEALGCGIKCVSTDVSGVKDMIFENVNGKVAEDRDPKHFARLIKDCLEIKTSPDILTNLAKPFSSSSLRERWSSLWKPLSDIE